MNVKDTWRLFEIYKQRNQKLNCEKPIAYKTFLKINIDSIKINNNIFNLEFIWSQIQIDYVK